MDSFSYRLSELIKNLGITKTAFSERLNISQAFVSQMCSGAKIPSDRTIADICREFGVREEWLRTGEGDMLLPVSEEDELMQALACLQVNENDPVRDLLIAYWKLPENEKAVIWKLITAMNEKKQKEKPEP